MNVLMLELLAIAILVSVVCAIPGVFLLLRGASLMSDAMSHALLLGIVIMFLWVRSLTSPLLIVGAGIAGFAVVVLTEYIMHRTRLTKDAAIALLFPAFFSGAVILICVYARDAHLDMDMVLLGDMVFAPFVRFIVYDYDCGPQALWIMGVLLIILLSIFYLVRRRLLVVLFDPVYASITHTQPNIVHYSIMGLTSIVAVSVFSLVGSVVVVALMIAPAASAYCTATSYVRMYIHAILYGVIAAIAGYFFAATADVSIAGSIAMMSGAVFLLVILCAPRVGLAGCLITHLKTWLQVSSALIHKYAITQKYAVFSKNTVQKIYGWSSLWTRCVFYYACKKGFLVHYHNELYQVMSHNSNKDINL